jgi:hypothetical protein
MRTLSAKGRRLVDRQWGRISAAQLVALGIDSWVIARWVDTGYLHVVHPRVYALGHRAPSIEADLTAAVLYAGPGAMLSHATALWWRGLLDKQPRTIDVSTPRRCRSIRGIRVHGRRSCERVWHNALPTTTVDQALLDYAAVAPLERVRHALANADYHHVLDIAALQVIAGNGGAKLRMALTRHEPKLARTRSPLERIFLPFCERARIPLPDDVNVWIEGVLVDAVWREQRVIVELDGKDNHSSWAQIQRDRSNELRLRAARYDVRRYGWAQLDDEPALVESDLIQALGLPR